jgi:hypothetical protein
MTDTRRENDMTKKLTEKPLTNTERQSKNREGRKQQDMWTDKFGFLAKPTPSGAWAAMELKQLERTLALLLIDYAEWEKEVVYAELLEYARLVTKQYEKAFAEIRTIEQTDREKQRITDG